MRIQLNGEAFELPDGETVSGLIERLDLAGRRVAVELKKGPAEGQSCRAKRRSVKKDSLRAVVKGPGPIPGP